MCKRAVWVLTAHERLGRANCSSTRSGMWGKRRDGSETKQGMQQQEWEQRMKAVVTSKCRVKEGHRDLRWAGQGG